LLGNGPAALQIKAQVGKIALLAHRPPEYSEKRVNCLPVDLSQ